MNHDNQRFNKDRQMFEKLREEFNTDKKKQETITQQLQDRNRDLMKDCKYYQKVQQVADNEKRTLQLQLGNIDTSEQCLKSGTALKKTLFFLGMLILCLYCQ